jgi:hypothetical protein
MRMLDRYTAALTAFHASRDVLLAVLLDHPQYPEVQHLRDRAFEVLLKARQLYWNHVAEHGCRRSACPPDLAFDKHRKISAILIPQDNN